MRPDVVWARVPDPGWPHPDGRPCIDVAMPERVAVSTEQGKAIVPDLGTTDRAPESKQAA